LEPTIVNRDETIAFLPVTIHRFSILIPSLTLVPKLPRREYGIGRIVKMTSSFTRDFSGRHWEDEKCGGRAGRDGRSRWRENAFSEKILQRLTNNPKEKW
jgi:hypothetical protein